MSRLLICICSGLFASAAMAETLVNQWLERLEDRGTEIEIIRVASEKPLVATEESDTEVASILKEAEALEEEIGDKERIEDPS